MLVLSICKYSIVAPLCERNLNLQRENCETWNMPENLFCRSEIQLEVYCSDSPSASIKFLSQLTCQQSKITEIRKLSEKAVPATKFLPSSIK